MTPRMLAQLSWVFERDAEELSGRGGRYATDAELSEACRLQLIASDLASRAYEQGQRTWLAHCFDEVGS